MTANPVKITGTHNPSEWKTRLVAVLRIMVLLLSLLLLSVITYDTLHDVSFETSASYLRLQFWVCLFFLADIVIEFALAENKSRHLIRNIPFILVSIPYLSIITHYNIAISPQLGYVIRFIPLFRTAYVVMLVSKMISRNWISSMFSGYIILLVTLLYFLSLMFYVEEHYVNPGVTSYWESLWFSVMQMTTCGSSIQPVTSSGRVISIVLSAAGLVLFPVFTVYFTKIFSQPKYNNPQ